MCGLAIAVCVQILVDAAAAAGELRFELDRHSRAVRLIDPLDAVLLAIGFALLTRRNVDAFAVAVEDLRLVPLRVDLNFVVVGRLLRVDPRDDLHRLAGRLHAVHAGRADADALLPAALPQPVELRAVQQLAEDQRNLLFDDARAVVLDADLVAIGRRSASM